MGSSVTGDDFVHVENGASDGGHGSQLSGVDICRQGRIAGVQELRRASGLLETRGAVMVEVGQRLALDLGGTAGDGLFESPVDAIAEIVFGVGEGVLSEHTRGLDV